MKNRDEHYIIDICDRVLGIRAKRQCRFDFLRGDPDKKGRCAKLPVDAYYENDRFKLVVEYRERQHTEAVPFFDKKQTCSNCGRDEQRRRYDERRRDVLPKHGIAFVELDYDLFAHDSRKCFRQLILAHLRKLTLAHLRKLSGPGFMVWRSDGSRAGA